MTPKPRKDRILIIDDEPLVGRFVGGVLRNAGFDVSYVENPMEGIHQAIEQRPDLVITDYEMKEVSGAELCVHLKSRHETKDVPVILISGKSGFDGQEIADFTGADAFFNKPMASSRLLRVVRDLLAQRVAG